MQQNLDFLMIGKSLENAVFLELKRKEFDIYYYRTSKSECDFLVFDKTLSVMLFKWHLIWVMKIQKVEK